MSASEFEKIRKILLKKGDLFEDLDFPTTQSSVFYHQTPPFQFQWKRPKEFLPNPVFLTDNPSSNFFDVSPGKLGDRWFVSCVGSLTLTKGLFYRVVPADQSFETHEYAGIFRFRVWWHGEWQEIIVDDRLPTVNNKLVFIQSAHGEHLWACLLEKAYAKLHGSYEALKYGCSVEGLADLTGGITETISLKEDPTSYGPMLGQLLSMTTIVTAIVHTPTSNSINANGHRHPYEKLANGIMISTNYRVLGVERLETLDGDQVQLIRLKNPLGLSSDYIGLWSWETAEWDRVSEDEKLKLNSKYEMDGDFWMLYSDFVKTFTTLEVIHLDSETSKDEPSLKGKNSWKIKLWRGIWRKGVTAGGCRNHVDTFHVNPQLQLVVSETDDMIISLNQHAVLEPKVIGFSVYQSPSTKLTPTANTDSRLEKAYFKRTKSYLNSPYTNSKQISVRCQVEEGTYVLLPTTYEPGQEGQFTVRIYSTQAKKLKYLDSVPCLVKPAIMKAPVLFDSKFAQYEAMFIQLADEHKTVNAYELQELLEASLPNDYVKSCATLDVCRQIVITLDVSGVGRLKYKDYKNVMCSLRFWQNTFKAHTKGTSGILRAEKLKDALYDIGFQLNNEILSFLVLRFMRKDGTLRFGDFVLCILHLTISFAVFEKKDPLQTGTVRMSLTEWLNYALAKHI